MNSPLGLKLQNIFDLTNPITRLARKNRIDQYINPDIVGEIMQYSDYATRRAMALTCKEWYGAFYRVIKPTPNQYARALRSRMMKQASVHIFNRQIFPVTFQDNLPFRAFCRFGCEDIVDQLLANPDVNPSAGKNRALRKACKHGHYNIVKKLVDDPRITVTDRALLKASDHKHWSIVKLLLQDPSLDPSIENNLLIQRAAASEQIDIVRMLLDDERVDPAACDNRALRYAAYNGHHQVVKLLLSCEDVDPSAQRNSALRRAVKRGHYYVALELLNDERIDPTLEDNEAYKCAVEQNQWEMIELLESDPRVQRYINQHDPPTKRRKKRKFSLRSSRSLANLPSITVSNNEFQKPTYRKTCSQSSLIDDSELLSATPLFPEQPSPSSPLSGSPSRIFPDITRSNSLTSIAKQLFTPPSIHASS